MAFVCFWNRKDIPIITPLIQAIFGDAKIIKSHYLVTLLNNAGSTEKVKKSDQQGRFGNLIISWHTIPNWALN
jgi:hypothetical protein